MGSDNTNEDMQRRQAEEERRRTEILQQANQPSAAEQRFNRQADEWDAWIQGGDYRTPPPDSALNFNLFTPAQEQRQREKYADLTGIGAAQMGSHGTKNQAAGLAREKFINQSAQENANNYEQAIKGQDAYFKGQAIPYAQLQQGRNMGLLNNVSGMEQFYTQQRVNTRRPGLFGQIFGGALTAGSSLLGNPNFSL